MRPFKKLSCFRPLRGRLVGVCDTPLQPGTCGPSKNYLVFVPFGAACGAYSIRPYDRVRVAFQKTILFSSPSRPIGGRMRYAPTTGYVRSFEIPMQFSNWVRAALQKTIPFSFPSGPRGGAYSIRPYDRVCAALQKTVPFPSPSGTSGEAYSIRPYDRVRAALQKTVSFSSPSGPSVGRIRYAPTTGYVRSFEILTQHPDRIRAILRNTDTISRVEGKGCLGGGAVGATVCGEDGRE